MQLTPNDIDPIWHDDKLGRKADAEFIHKFLIGRLAERKRAGSKQSYVLSIDAGWGRGKTFFLHRFGDQLRSQGHIVAKVDAWRDDFADDPLIAVMSAIDLEIDPYLPKIPALPKAVEALRANLGEIVRTAAKGAVLQASKRLIGAGVDDLVAAFNAPIGAESKETPLSRASGATAEAAIGDTLAAVTPDRLIGALAMRAMSDFRSGQQSIKEFKKNLESAINALSQQPGIPAPLFVLVDELDRCRPPYAIATLERIKHLFDVDGVVFVIAVNAAQLAHSIQAVYGTNFEAKEYLTRFFDRTYALEPADPAHIVAELLATSPLPVEKISIPGNGPVDKFLSGSLAFFNESPRNIAKIYDLISTVVTMWDKPILVEMAYLLPLATLFVRTGSLESADGTSVFPALRQGIAPGASDAYVRLQSTENRDEIFNPEACFIALSKLIDKPLPEIYRADEIPAATAVHRWATRKLRDEFALLHHRSYPSGMPPMTILREYPAMIRQAGRLLR